MTRALSEQEIFRRKSLQELRDLGIEPYPAAMFDINTTSINVIGNKYHLEVNAQSANDILNSFELSTSPTTKGYLSF